MAESVGRTSPHPAPPLGGDRTPVPDIVLGALAWAATAAFATAVLLVLAGAPALVPVAALAVLVVGCAAMVLAGRTRTPRRTADGRDAPAPSTTTDPAA